MNFLKHFSLAILFSLATLTASAYDFEVDGIYYNTTSLQDLTCEVTYKDLYYNTYSGDIVIPSSVAYNGKTFSVTGIGGSAFCSSRSLTSVVIPNSVTSIGGDAFVYCSSLISVVIPNSVTSIDCSAFAYCSSLTSVVIPNSVIEIGIDAFAYCSSLTSVVIPNSVIEIGNGAFSFCSNLTSIVIPNSLTSINWNTFFNCPSLTSIMIPNSVNNIFGEAFNYCSNLKEIVSLNTTPPSLSNDPFRDVSKTEAIVRVPDEALNAYKVADGWKAFWNIVGLSGGGGEQCAAPEIKIVDGKVVATTATDGAKCYTSITSDDFKGYDGNEPIPLSGVYNISSYAHADGYQNSESVTKTFNMFDLSQSSTVVEVHDTIYKDKIVEVEVPVEKIVEVHDTIEVEKMIEVHDTIEVEKIVEKIVEVHDTIEVEKIVEIEVPVEVIKEVEKIVEIEVPVEVIKEVEKIVEVHDTLFIYDDTRSDIKLETGDVMTLYVRDGVVYIENAPICAAVTVYKENGVMYMMKTVEETVTSLALPRKQLYIIKIGNKVIKVKI